MGGWMGWGDALDVLDELDAIPIGPASLHPKHPTSHPPYILSAILDSIAEFSCTFSVSLSRAT